MRSSDLKATSSALQERSDVIAYAPGDFDFLVLRKELIFLDEVYVIEKYAKTRFGFIKATHVLTCDDIQRAKLTFEVMLNNSLYHYPAEAHVKEHA